MSAEEGHASVSRDRRARAPVGHQGAPPLAYVRFELLPEMLQRGEHRRHGRVTERAQRLPADVGGDAAEQIDVAHGAFATLDPLKQLVKPVGPLAARRALAARLVT